MAKKIDLITVEVLKKINPPKDKLIGMKKSLEEFISKLKKRIDELKINAEVFVGGSFAKNTLIKKSHYDVDVFLRFSNEDYRKDISELTNKCLKGFKSHTKIHGSRDYFRIKIDSDFFIELVPVKKIKKISEADNITDLSYSHVKYINKKIKSKKILDEIKIAKAFCHANGYYGAESYVNGFSGYSLELLVHHYKGFFKFMNVVSKSNAGEKIVIDMEKHYKNKQNVLLDLNSAKLESPIILIDPTYKQRNALAALSEETFKKFKKDCIKFLKNPSIKAFEEKGFDFNKIEKNALKNKNEFSLLEAKTNKQEGDVAGSKLIKFFKYLESESKRFFIVKKSGFDYLRDKSAKYFFVVKPKKEIILEGPYSKDKKNSLRFKKKHKKVFEKKGKLYSKKEINFSFKEFVKSWIGKNKKRLSEMSIVKLNFILKV